MTAKFYRGLSEVTSGISYKWYKQVYGANPGTALENWQELTGQNTSTLTVTEADVDSSQRYMVHVLDPTGTTVLGQDTQMVYDASDFYEIGIKRNPEDGQVHKAGDSIEVTCEVYRRGKTVPEVLTSPSWTFIGVTPAGTKIMQQNPSASNKCTITYDDIFSAGGQLELTASVEF